MLYRSNCESIQPDNLDFACRTGVRQPATCSRFCRMRQERQAHLRFPLFGGKLRGLGRSCRCATSNSLPPLPGLPLAFGHRPSGDRFAGGQQPFEHSPCGLRPSLTLGPSFRRGQNAVARPRWGGRPGLRPPTSFGRALRFASASHGQTRRLPPVTGQRYLSWIVGRTKDSLEKGFLWCWLFWFREFIECQQCHLLLRDCFFLRFNQLFLGY